MRNSIRSKVYLAFGLILLFTIILAITSVTALRNVRERYNSLINVDARLVSLAYETRASVGDQGAAVRAYLLSGDPTYRNAFERSRREYETTRDEMQRLIHSDTGRQLAKQAFTAVDAYYAVAQREAASGRAGTATPVPPALLRLGFDEASRVKGAVQEMIDYKRKSLDADIDAAARDYRRTLAWVSALALAAAVVAVGMGYWLTAGIVGPILALTRGAERISAGDLETQVPVRTRDETARLASAFNAMTTHLAGMVASEREGKARLEDAVHSYLSFVEQVGHGDLTVRLAPGGNDELAELGRGLDSMVSSLRELATQITAATNDMAAATTEILAAAAQQTSSASEQSSAVQETTTAVEEVRRMVGHAEERAREVAEMARQSAEVAAGGQKSVDDTIGGMHTIRERVQSIANNMLGLSERTQRIDAIVATVNDITEQSRLLALNASIEAARAGEHGRGFAVVADEMRSLTEQSADATRQVRGLLEEIRSATNAAVMATEQGIRVVDEGVKRAEGAGQTIGQLADSVHHAAAAMETTAQGAEQEAAGVQQISTAMADIQRATAQALASTREAERAAEDMSRLARDLKDLSGHYRV